jgi:hypothetical protein
MENTDDFIYFKDRNHVFTGASQTLVSISLMLPPNSRTRPIRNVTPCP